MPEETQESSSPVSVVDADTAPSSYVDWVFPYLHFPPGVTNRSETVASLSLGRFRVLPAPLQRGETPPPENQVKVEFVAQMTFPTLRMLRDLLDHILADPEEVSETPEGSVSLDVVH